MAKRRKYRFPSREAAENACREVEQDRIIAQRALRLLYCNQPAGDFSAGYYRAIVLGQGSHSEELVVMVWQPPGQVPSVSSHNAWDWSQFNMEFHARHADHPEARQVYELAAEVRKLLYQLNPQVPRAA